MTLIRKEAFRVSMNRAQSKAERKRKLINRKRRIQWRLRDHHWTDQPRPMFSASNIHYELADRARGLGPGGIGAMHLLAWRTGLVEAIDRRLHLLKVHLPYHESDHVLNIAYNLLAGGTCLEDIELWRNDEVYLDALGAQRIPDPTTAGDFCRRFDTTDEEGLEAPSPGCEVHGQDHASRAAREREGGHRARAWLRERSAAVGRGGRV